MSSPCRLRTHSYSCVLLRSACTLSATHHGPLTAQFPPAFKTSSPHFAAKGCVHETIPLVLCTTLLLLENLSSSADGGGNTDGVVRGMLGYHLDFRQDCGVSASEIGPVYCIVYTWYGCWKYRDQLYDAAILESTRTVYRHFKKKKKQV